MKVSQMKSMWKKLLVALVVVSGAYGVVAAPALLAQKAESKADAKAPAKTEAKKVSRRLPNFYGDLVDGAQKEKIYAVQDKYGPQIDALAEQVKALQAKRDAEIEAVLTPEQKAKLEKARADSKAKAQERAAAKKAAEKAPAATTAAPVVPATATTPAKK
jgi:colicin import membrane protein